MKILPLLLLVIAIAAGVWYLNGSVVGTVARQVEPKAAPMTPADATVPARAAKPELSTPPPEKAAAASPAPVSDPKQQAEFAAQVAQSQRLAAAKYPGLAVQNTELNTRFVFRYKTLVAEHSPRLQDPAWPMLLADECAAASGPKAKAPANAPKAAASSAWQYRSANDYTGPTAGVAAKH